MDLTQDIARARAELGMARFGEVERISEAVRAHGVVGVLGEAEVGKTETIRQALNLSDAHPQVVRLDLDGAASDAHVGFLLAQQIARAVLGERDLSLLSGGVLLPPRVAAGRTRLAEVLGVDGLDEALREWPSGRFASNSAFRALEAIVQHQELVVWIDHIEAPSLTPRHPLRLGELLWGIRELSQRAPGLTVVVSGHEALEREILGPRAAFHQQGRWLSIAAPAAATWGEVAHQLGTSARWGKRLAALTGGHPTTMLLALLHEGAKPSRPTRPEDVLLDLAVRDDGLVARAMQHARSLHRLGGQVLLQIAHGQRPYGLAQRGAATPQEIRKVLTRLRVAGLLRRADGWAIVNPLVAIRLRGSLQGPLSVDDEDVNDQAVSRRFPPHPSPA